MCIEDECDKPNFRNYDRCATHLIENYRNENSERYVELYDDYEDANKLRLFLKHKNNSNYSLVEYQIKEVIEEKMGREWYFGESGVYEIEDYKEEIHRRFELLEEERNSLLLEKDFITKENENLKKELDKYKTYKKELDDIKIQKELNSIEEESSKNFSLYWDIKKNIDEMEKEQQQNYSYLGVSLQNNSKQINNYYDSLFERKKMLEKIEQKGHNIQNKLTNFKKQH